MKFHSKLSRGLVISLVLLGISCTELDEEVFDKVSTDDFFQTEEQFVAAMGDAYSKLHYTGSHATWWTLNEVSSDELVVTVKGGDWFDHLLPQLHRHQITPYHDHVNNMWMNSYDAINTCNRLIYQFISLQEKGNSIAVPFIAELRGLRALWYYWLLDSFGNVPIVVDFVDDEPPPNNSDFQEGRTSVYEFVESELNEIIPQLTTKVGGAAYGRFNRASAFFLRSKLYLNAEVFTDSEKIEFARAINDVDSVMNFGYSLEENYKDNFSIDNTGSSENIFVVPYERGVIDGFNWGAMTLHYESQKTFNFAYQPWNGYAVVEDFYMAYVDPVQNPGPLGPVWTGIAEFDDMQDPGSETPNGIGTLDARLSNFLVGPQVNADGTSTKDPMFEDENAVDPDPDGIRLNFTPHNNEISPYGWRQGGARIDKYEYEMGANESMSNDFVIFRFADALLTKAEAQWRLGNNSEALSIINQIRSRANVDLITDLDAPVSFNPSGPEVPGGEILNERGREMFAETTRRQDLIRFGLWGEPWWEKPASSEVYEVFPIPQWQLDAGSLLYQNPGY